MRFALSLALALLSYSVHADDPKPTAKPDFEQAVVDALGTEKPFAKGEYKYVRGIFAKYFEQKYASEIKAGLEDNFDTVMAWLNANPEVKETLYTAINPDKDDVEKALGVFAELHKLGPDKLKTHANLAIACAVVWDQPTSVYDYRGHQVRTKSILPENAMKQRAKHNYEYLINNETALKGTVQLLPWEFLVHVVNHYTPIDERTWAMEKYLKRRFGIGTCYKDVEYDMMMLRTQSERCKLNGQPYTLPSIQKYGGVCAMQADYAARVAKSLGVPAEYVGGEGNSGGRHAWVMWVEVKSVTKEKIDFALVSEGRYFTDNYYVGELKDPQTGEKTTDRQMELHLATVGAAPIAGRQADLLMRFFPIVRDRKNLNPKQQMSYLGKVLEIFPHAEKAWKEMATLHKEKKVTDQVEALKYTNKAFTTFMNYPDFSWAVSDDLLTPVKEKITRAEQFNKLVTRYEALNRPDLACEARMKLSEYQVEAKDYKKAADGLANTIIKFPSEGRYVPKMMDKLADVCSQYKGGTDLLAKFYLQLLPKVPMKRGDDVSEYCVKLHQQALEFFQKNNKPKEAEAVEAQLKRLKAAKG